MVNFNEFFLRNAVLFTRDEVTLRRHPGKKCVREKKKPAWVRGGKMLLLVELFFLDKILFF